MHVSEMVHPSLFTARSGHDEIPVTSLMPDWQQSDRLGVVVTTPFGTLQATLLLHVAALQFYQVRPERRGEHAQYPQIYIFHVGGPHGDNSSFDVWPARHEVFVPANDPYRLLGEINDRAITRLALPALPDGHQPGSLSYIDEGPSGWTDAGAARERITTVLTYGIDSPATPDTITLTCTDHEILHNTEYALDGEATANYFRSQTDQQLLDMNVGPSTAHDLRQWTELFAARTHEVPAELRHHLMATLNPHTQHQHYQHSTIETALTQLPHHTTTTTTLSRTAT